MPIYPGERCQHIKMNGDRCGSPALRDQKFCYFHARCRPVKVDVSTSAAEPPAPFFLPVLEDVASIRLAITQVCEHLLHRRLDAKKAGVLLYAMQVASSNLDRPSKDKSQDNSGAPDGAPGVPARPEQCLRVPEGAPGVPPGRTTACRRRRERRASPPGRTNACRGGATTASAPLTPRGPD
jgi:hypothetical protein